MGVRIQNLRMCQPIEHSVRNVSWPKIGPIRSVFDVPVHCWPLSMWHMASWRWASERCTGTTGAFNVPSPCAAIISMCSFKARNLFFLQLAFDAAHQLNPRFLMLLQKHCWRLGFAIYFFCGFPARALSAELCPTHVHLAVSPHGRPPPLCCTKLRSCTRGWQCALRMSFWTRAGYLVLMRPSTPRAPLLCSCAPRFCACGHTPGPVHCACASRRVPQTLWHVTRPVQMANARCRHPF